MSTPTGEPVTSAPPSTTPATNAADQAVQVEKMAAGGGGAGIKTVGDLRTQAPQVYLALCEAIVQNGFNFMNDSQQRIHDMNVETYNEGSG